jgi:acyl carrier protein
MYFSPMELNVFVKQFADCLMSEDASAIHAQTEFKKLDEWGSMMALIVIAMVDSEYNKTLTAEDIHAAKTIEALFKIVEEK